MSTKTLYSHHRLRWFGHVISMQENSTGKALGWEPSKVVDIRAQHRFDRRSTSAGRHGRQGDQQKWVEELDYVLRTGRTKV